MEKKRNSIIAVVIIILIIGLVGYIVMDKKILKPQNQTTPEKQEVNKIIKLDTDNANIKALINKVHNPSEQLDTLIYNTGGSKVENMNEEYKFSIATNEKNINIKTINPPDKTGNTGYVTEQEIKDAYEKLFGPGTYQQIDSFKLGCINMTYDKETKRYTTTKKDCGIAITPVRAYEEIISATKQNNTLTIITAAIFYDASIGKLFKDSDLTKETPQTANTSLSEQEIREYITNNKDGLNQYTYTFDIGVDGFYYYKGVERTKE